MTHEDKSREVKGSEIIDILKEQKLTPKQVSEAYTAENEFVGVKKIRDKLREMAESEELEEDQETVTEPMYSINKSKNSV